MFWGVGRVFEVTSVSVKLFKFYMLVGDLYYYELEFLTKIDKLEHHRSIIISTCMLKNNNIFSGGDDTQQG